MATYGERWRLAGYDTFSGEDYALDGEYPTEQAARAAAKVRLAELEVSQPTASSAAQDGIQDRVYIVAPDGSTYRYVPATTMRSR